MHDTSTSHYLERVETVVVGAGQAGLAVAQLLARRGRQFVVLEASPRVGDVWRARWDSLRLFTPARFDGIAGQAFPAHGDAFPTKDEMADYLEGLVRRFALPVDTGVRVERVSRERDHYLVTAGTRRLRAEHVVVACAGHHRAYVPAFAAALAPGTRQLHSSDYRNPSQLRDGPVLVVGAGNSGAEIAVELARAGHAVTLAGRDPGEVPFRIEGRASRLLLARLVLRGVFHRLLTLHTPMGRRAGGAVGGRGGPRVRVKARDLAAAGVARAGRVTAVRDGQPVIEGDATLPVANVVWCTGFRPAFEWLDLPVFDAAGRPRHERGVAVDEPGLYFVGLPFQFAMSSAMIHGVTRDAAHVVDRLVERGRAAAGGGAVAGSAVTASPSS